MEKHEYELLNIEIGFRPKGLNTEQHDMVWAIGRKGSHGNVIGDPAVHEAICRHLDHYLKNGETIHIDGWAVVNQVDGYKIQPLKKPVEVVNDHNLKLFFANLGAYRIGSEREKHKSMFLLAGSVDQVKSLALADPFAYEMDKIPGAPPHLDDKAQISVDVEDVAEVADFFPDFDFAITKNPDTPDSWKDWNITGYKIVKK